MAGAIDADKPLNLIEQNWRRALIRLWVAVSVLWIGVITWTIGVEAIIGPHVSNHLMDYVVNAFGLPLAVLAIGFVGARVADRSDQKSRVDDRVRAAILSRWLGINEVAVRDQLAHLVIDGLDRVEARSP